MQQLTADLHSCITRKIVKTIISHLICLGRAELDTILKTCTGITQNYDPSLLILIHSKENNLILDHFPLQQTSSARTTFSGMFLYYHFFSAIHRLQLYTLWPNQSVALTLHASAYIPLHSYPPAPLTSEICGYAFHNTSVPRNYIF